MKSKNIFCLWFSIFMVLLFILFFFFNPVRADTLEITDSPGFVEGFVLHYSDGTNDYSQALTEPTFDLDTILIPGVPYTLILEAWNGAGGSMSDPQTYTRAAYSPTINPGPAIYVLPPNPTFRIITE